MDRTRLEGVWFHSHEEDRGGRIVYRTRNFDFPPSRAGRESLNLHPDGTAEVGTVGPTDAAELEPGTWELSDADVLTVVTSNTRQAYEVKAADDQQIILKLKSP